MSEPVNLLRPSRSRGLFIGRYFQIRFYLDYSWFLIAAIVTYTFTTTIFPRLVTGLTPGAYLIMGSSAAFFFFFSIILHELGHSLVSQRCGIPVPRITLLFIGGLAEISREPDDARSELKIALGGPIVSLVLVALYAGLRALFLHLGWAAPAAVCDYLAGANLLLVLFNMVPGYPLDGGRILRALIWARTGRLRRATFITSRVGVGFAWLLILGGLYLLFVLQAWGGASLLLVGMFLRSAAETGYSHALQKEVLGGVTVRDVMTPQPICIPATTPLNLAVDDFFLTNHHVAFPVTGDEGEFRGLLRLDFLKGVPREKWPFQTAGDLAFEQETTALQVEARLPAGQAMQRLLAQQTGRLVVTENSRVIGIITRHDILHFIKIHTELEA